MDPFTAVVIGTTALQIYGQYKANTDEAKAHQANADQAEKMAEYNKLSTKRELEVYTSQYNKRQAQTELAYGASGVDMAGSVLDQLAFSNQVAQQEIDDINLKGQMNIDELLFQADMHSQAANAASDPTNNSLQAGGTILSGYSTYLGAKS